MTFGITSFDLSALTQMPYRGATNTRSTPAARSNTTSIDTRPPWEISRAQPDQGDLVRRALGGSSAIESARLKAAKQIGGDREKLLAVYNGVQTLTALVDKAAAATTSDAERARLAKTFARSLDEVGDFVDANQLSNVTIARGASLTKHQTAALQRTRYEYTGRMIQTGSTQTAADIFSGDVKFAMRATRSDGSDVTVNIDLADMGSTVRSLDNVIEHVNGKLTDAGLTSRINRVKVPYPPPVKTTTTTTNPTTDTRPDQWALRVSGAETERLYFDPPADADPLVRVVGNVGAAKSNVGLVASIRETGTGPQTVNTDRREGEVDKTNTVLASAAGADGATFVLQEVTGALDGQTTRGKKDVMLSKLDSAGKVVWSRNMGALTAATGTSIAASADGKVAITGVSSDKLETGATGTGNNGFVTLFDATGTEVWTRQRGVSGDDALQAVSFSPTGDVVVAGRSSSPFPGQTSLGGEDVVLQSYSASGSLNWSKSLGSASADRAQAMTIAADGSMYLAMSAGDATQLRKLDATGTEQWTQTLSTSVGTKVNSLALGAGGRIYAVGSANALAQATTNAQAGGHDGFVMALDDPGDGSAATNAWSRWLGSTGDDAARAVSVVGSDLYVAGEAAGQIEGTNIVGTRNAFVSKITDTGNVSWTQTITGRDGITSAAGISVDPTGGSILEKLGMPKAVQFGDVGTLAERTGVRPGDHFFVSVDGKSQKKVAIGAGETLRTLTYKINREIGLAGRAQITSTAEGQVLRIVPREGSRIALSPGTGGADGLAPLGLKEGFVAMRELNGDSTSPGPQIVGMDLSSSVTWTDKASATEAKKQVETMARRVREAWRASFDPPPSTVNSRRTSGTVPAYLTAQLANYQGALAKISALTGT